MADSVSTPHEKADICAVWDALCYGLPPPLSLSPGKSSTGKSGSLAYLQSGALATSGLWDDSEAPEPWHHGFQQ